MFAAIATSSSPHSFIRHSLSPYTRKAKLKTPKTLVISCRKSSLDNESNDDSPRIFSKPENQLAKLAIVTLAAGVLTLGSVQDAYAAKSGGRIGGQAFRSSAPRSSGPRINNSRTNIYVNPPVAPPLVGGYGYYGGWGWSPFSFFAPVPGVAVGVGGVFDLFVFILFLGTFGAVIRRVFRPRDDDDYY